MKTRLIRLAAASAVAAAFSAGALAHEEPNVELRGAHWLQHAAEAPSAGAAATAGAAENPDIAAIGWLAQVAQSGGQAVAGQSAPLGYAVPGAAARTVELAPGVRAVNVTHTETVTFKAGVKSFTWKFDTLGTPSFPLSKIAPQGFDAGSVQVYMDHPVEHLGG